MADPDLIRRLDIGQACYIHRGAATFVQVARPTPSPLSLPAAQVPVAAPGPRQESTPGAARPAWPEPGPPSVEGVLGPEAGP